MVGERLFPVPERLHVAHLPARADNENAGQGILVVRVPAQDNLLRPFVLHDVVDAGDGNTATRITLVEREGAESVARSVAAIHAALAAGTAFLRG